MRIGWILRWRIPAALLVTLAGLAFGVTWQGDRQAGVDVVYAATWTGNWTLNSGHWTGTIKFKFDDGGDKTWTAAEKIVLREAVKEWEDLAASDIDFDEVTSGEDITFRWGEDEDRDGNAFGGNVAGRVTGVKGAPATAAPTGADFHTDPTHGVYVDPDPTTDEEIPDVQWDLLSVAKHEIGHVLGLKHSYKKDGVESVDWDVWTNDERQRLTEKDGIAATNLYPIGAVGGIEVPFGDSGFAAGQSASSGGSSAPPYAALAGAVAASAVALAAGAWYAWRRWLR